MSEKPDAGPIEESSRPFSEDISKFVTDEYHERFVREGANVVAVYRNEEPVKWLTDLGQAAIIDYYYKAYGVRIIALNHIKEMPAYIEALDTLHEDKEIKTGFIINESMGVHFVPSIYVKEIDKDTGNYKKSIFISDSVGSTAWQLGMLAAYTSLHNIDLNIDAIKELAAGKIRQASGRDCKTDSLVWTKDALRLDTKKFKIYERDKFIPFKIGKSSGEIKINLFHCPEDLMKSAQRSVYLTNSKADLEASLVTTSMKKLGRDRTKKPIKTLAEKRKASEKTFHYEYSLCNRGELGARDPSKDGDFTEASYLFDKGYRFEQIIRENYLSKSPSELENILKFARGEDILAEAQVIKTMKEASLEAARSSWGATSHLSHRVGGTDVIEAGRILAARVASDLSAAEGVPHGAPDVRRQASPKHSL